MIYQFSGICIKINGLDPKLLEEFAIFRANNQIRGSHEVNVDIVPIDYMPDTVGEKVFSDPSGVDVFLQDNKEYRIFHEFFNADNYAALQPYDEFGHKELRVYRPYIENKQIDERRLFNCIAPEKDLMRLGRLILHSSFIETQRGAVLFTAPCQTGKSTQAELWRLYRGADIHNGDRSCIYKKGDSWYAGGIPWCGTSGIMHNVNVPLCAIVVLSQGPNNVIRRIGLKESLMNLMKQTTINPWDREMILSAQNIWIDVLEKIPVFHLSCLPNEGAVQVLAKEIGVDL